MKMVKFNITNILIFVFAIAVLVMNFCVFCKTNEGFDYEAENDLWWDQLDPERRDAWSTLGWTQSSWDNDPGNSCTPCDAKKSSKKQRKKEKKKEKKKERGERRTKNATNKAGREAALSSEDPDPCTSGGWKKKKRSQRSDCDESVKIYNEKRDREKKRGRSGKQFKNIIRKWLGERIRGAQAKGGGYVAGKYYK